VFFLRKLLLVTGLWADFLWDPKYTSFYHLRHHRPPEVLMRFSWNCNLLKFYLLYVRKIKCVSVCLTQRQTGTPLRKTCHSVECLPLKLRSSAVFSLFFTVPVHFRALSSSFMLDRCNLTCCFSLSRVRTSFSLAKSFSSIIVCSVSIFCKKRFRSSVKYVLLFHKDLK